METFKQSKWWIDSDAKDSFSINVINNIQQLMNLDAFLMRHNCVLIVKIHHLQNTAFLTVTDLQRIYYITDDDLFNADIQVNDLLNVSDMLLTDYSSVCYDYLLCDKPIGYMVSDKDEYARGFLIDDVFSIMPGKKIYNYTQLCDFIESYFVAGKDEYLPDRRRLKEKIFKYNDSDNCKRLYEWLLKTGKDRYL
jgi:CDP-glycerol glycerophosphotransferase (TagB/SpsB family)